MKASALWTHTPGEKRTRLAGMGYLVGDYGTSGGREWKIEGHGRNRSSQKEGGNGRGISVPSMTGVCMAYRAPKDTVLPHEGLFIAATREKRDPRTRKAPGWARGREDRNYSREGK